MVSGQDLQEDYEDILQTGELTKKVARKRTSAIFKGMVLVIVIILSSWTFAWLYNW